MDHSSSTCTNGITHSILEDCLQEILALIKPSANDRVKRVNTINELAALIRPILSLKDASVKPFGSFISDLYTKSGDLDISVQLPNSLLSSRKRKQNALREIMRTLRRRGVARNIQLIPHARVPLLIYESVNYGISCDVSIDNHLGLIKSRILHWISATDERFHDMILLIKEWAKTQDINDPKSGTLNSYSLCLLVIFHFQTCEPAILPPLMEIYEENFFDDVAGKMLPTEEQIDNVCNVNMRRFKYDVTREGNTSSLSQLLVSFFDKFSGIEAICSDYAICTYTGRWERIRDNPTWMVKCHPMLIEDPFEKPDNAARAVALKELNRIAYAFADTFHKLSAAPVLSHRSSLLSILTRPDVYSRLGVRGQANHDSNGSQWKYQHVASTGYAVAEPIFGQLPILKGRRQRLDVPIHGQFPNADGGHQKHPQVETMGYRKHGCVESTGYAVHSPFFSQPYKPDRTHHVRTTGYVAEPLIHRQFSDSNGSRQKDQQIRNPGHSTNHHYRNNTGYAVESAHHKLGSQRNHAQVERVRYLPGPIFHEPAPSLEGRPQSSSSNVILQRHGATLAQDKHKWRPRSRNDDMGL